jgi:hypothetical protein
MIKRIITIMAAVAVAAGIAGLAPAAAGVHPPTAAQMRAADRAAHVALSCAWFTQEEAFPVQGDGAQAEVIQNSGCPGRKIEVVAYCLMVGGGNQFVPGNAVWVVGAVSEAFCPNEEPLQKDGVRISDSTGNFAGSVVIRCWYQGIQNPRDCPPGV